MAKKKAYDNDSISSLKGADRVRKRPGVIFGSDGLEGCEHAVFEILSNAIDEARAGFGRVITVTRFQDRSIQVEDQGRGCPVDWNEKEGRYNWELVFCEMYAGGKYDPTGENYEFSLGLNGLGSCATQYASRYMDVTVCRDGNEYKLHFQRGEIVGQMEVTPLTRKKTGTTIRWLPDLEVFTDIDIPLDYYQDVMKRQAVVNAGVTFRLRDEVSPGRFETQDFLYENGIRDYLAELAGDDPITRPVCWEAERQGRDRADKPEYKVKLNIAWCFSNRVHLMEHYHNSSFLEHGGSPDKATRLAFVAALDKYLRENNKYTKGESKITFPDVQECLLLVSSNFSTQTSYENQTKKAITNKFIQDAMSEFLRHQLQVFFIETRPGADQQAQPGDGGAHPPGRQEEAVGEDRHRQPGAEVCGLPHQGGRPAGDLYRGGRLGSGRLQAVPGRGVPGADARPGQDPQLPEGRLSPDLQKRRDHGPDEGAGLRRGGSGQGRQGAEPV